MCHVLIIEDEPLIAINIQATLEDAGATSFDFAASESEAVAAALANHPTLITSDVKLVSGTGPAAVREIYRQLGEVPVIFISATPEECRPCNPPGIILAKPFRQEALKAAFRQLL